jgi:hypothetical protein
MSVQPGQVYLYCSFILQDGANAVRAMRMQCQ